MNTYLEHKKRKNGFHEVTNELITPEKPIKPTENTKVKQLADNSFPYYTEKTTEAGSTAPRKNATTDPLGLYKTPSVSAEKTTQAVEIETLKELPAPKEEIDLSQDTRYKVTKRSIPYDPADSWLEGNNYTPGNGTQNYIEMQGNLREYLERTEREITELEEKNDQKLKNSGYAERRLGQIDKLNGMIDRYYDFYDRFKNDLPWWKNSEEMEDELAFLTSERKALQNLQRRLTKPSDNGAYQTLPYRVSYTPPQTEKLSLNIASPQTAVSAAARVSAAASQPTTSSAGNANFTAQPAATASAGKTNLTAAECVRIVTANSNNYNFGNVGNFIVAAWQYLDNVATERRGIDPTSYINKNTFNAQAQARIGQIDKAIAQTDWYLEYIKEHYDELLHTNSEKDIQEFMMSLKGIRDALDDEKMQWSGESKTKSAYTSQWQWDKNYEPQIDFENKSLEEILNDYFAYYDEDGNVHFLEGWKVLNRLEEIGDLMLSASPDEWWDLFYEQELYLNQEASEEILSSLYYEKVLEKYPRPEKYTPDNVIDYLDRIKVFLLMNTWNEQQKREAKEFLKAFYGEIGKPGYYQKHMPDAPNWEICSIFNQLQNLSDLDYKSGGYGFNEGIGFNSFYSAYFTLINAKEYKEELDRLVERAEKEDRVAFTLGEAVGTLVLTFLIKEGVFSKISKTVPFESGVQTTLKQMLQMGLTSATLEGVKEIGNVVSNKSSSENLVKNMAKGMISGCMQTMVGIGVEKPLSENISGGTIMKIIITTIIEEIVGMLMD